jgi:hypothetical protein
MNYFVKTSKISRPPTAAEIPPRFDILDSVRDILKNTTEIELKLDGLLGFPIDWKSENFKINLSALLDSRVDAVIEQILNRRNFIFGMRLSAPRLHPGNIERLISETMTTGILNYLVELDLSYFELSHTSTDLLCKTINPIVSGYCPIKRLILTRSGLGVHGASAIFAALTGNIFLEELVMNGNHATDSAMLPLIKLLSHTQSRLRIISLGSNDITARGMTELGVAIGPHPYLEEVFLNDNPIGDEGAMKLFKHLRDNNNLTTLNLCHCNMKKCDWGPKLQVMLMLRSLNCSQNLIDDEGFKNICDGLIECLCLRHIDLSYNRFGGEICKMMAGVLKENQGLISLSLAGNVFHEEVVKALAFALQSNRTLNKFDMQWCSITQPQAQQFCSMLAKNQTCVLLLDNNPISYIIRADPRKWNPVEHEKSLGSDTLGLKMVRPANAPTLRQLRKKLREEEERHKNTEGRIINERERAILDMENLEKAAIKGISLEDLEHENPIKRSDQIEMDSRVYATKPKDLSLGFASNSIDNAKTWRDGKLSVVEAQRAVVNIMNERTKKKEKIGFHYAKIGDEEESTMADGQSTTSDNQKDHKSLHSNITIHIAPALGALKVRRHLEEESMAKEVLAGRKRILSVSYGNRHEQLGGIEVEESTTYEQARDMVLPLVRNYLASSDRNSKITQSILAKLLTEFSFLDGNGEPVLGDDTHIRTVWSELSQCGYFLDIRPAGYTAAPQRYGAVVGDLDSDEDLDDDVDGDTERRVDAYD